MNATGSGAVASPGEATAITVPVRTIGTYTIPAPPTVAPTIAAPEAVRGR